MGMNLSCKKFIEIEAPRSSIVPSTVFDNNDLAISAMLGIYQQMAVTGYASGDMNSISSVCGLSADEFLVHNTTLAPFFQNQLPIDNSTIRGIWTAIYARIYNANTILEGLQSENKITPPITEQLQGEALFTRAFNYFYLVRLFGDVPLYLTTDYKSNSIAKRTPIEAVYNQIVQDLKEAETKLSDVYITSDRVRPNKATVQSLLAKVFLDLRDWENAEKYTSIILEKTSLYSLVPLDDVFLKNSRETIWQLMPTANSNTPAGSLLILTSAPAALSLRPDFVSNSFEANDLRKTSWIKNIVVQGTTYYYPFKYKVKSSTTVTEYSMVFRLAEQYLIRAEARAYRDKLSGAIEDLDAIRLRAGLKPFKDTNPSISKADLLVAIQKERFVELFSEWGNRWFDLKRNGKSTEVLGPIKTQWSPSAILFPIPKLEIDNNKNIVQNDGY